MRMLLFCAVLLLAPSAVIIGSKYFETPLEPEKLQIPADSGQAKHRGEVLFFNASWCGPCRQMKPIVTALRRQGYHMRDVDVDRNRSLAEKYGIRGIPTFVFLENGKEVKRFSGGTSPEKLKSMCASSAYH